MEMGRAWGKGLKAAVSQQEVLKLHTETTAAKVWVRAKVLTESEPSLELELSNFFLLRLRVDLRRGVVAISASGLGLVTVRPAGAR